MLDGRPYPFRPFVGPCATAGDFIEPQAAGTWAFARGFEPLPNAGNSSSEVVSGPVEVGGFDGSCDDCGMSFAFCFPNAFSESGSGAGVAVALLASKVRADGGGWRMSSSSTTSSTVGL